MFKIASSEYGVSGECAALLDDLDEKLKGLSAGLAKINQSFINAEQEHENAEPETAEPKNDDLTPGEAARKRGEATASETDLQKLESFRKEVSHIVNNLQESFAQDDLDHATCLIRQFNSASQALSQQFVACLNTRVPQRPACIKWFQEIHSFLQKLRSDLSAINKKFHIAKISTEQELEIASTSEKIFPIRLEDYRSYMEQVKNKIINLSRLAQALTYTIINNKGIYVGGRVIIEPFYQIFLTISGIVYDAAAKELDSEQKAVYTLYAQGGVPKEWDAYFERANKELDEYLALHNGTKQLCANMLKEQPTTPEELSTYVSNNMNAILKRCEDIAAHRFRFMTVKPQPDPGTPLIDFPNGEKYGDEYFSDSEVDIEKNRARRGKTREYEDLPNRGF